MVGFVEVSPKKFSVEGKGCCNQISIGPYSFCVLDFVGVLLKRVFPMGSISPPLTPLFVFLDLI
jgi:hypothetical protein